MTNDLGMRPAFQTQILPANRLLSDDPQLLNRAEIHAFLANESYWCRNVPYGTIDDAINNSYSFGITEKGQQLAFARLVTDYATFAYLCDVYVHPSVRGQGLSKLLMSFWMEQEWVKKLRRLLLATQDAHGLYTPFGFEPLPFPERFLTIARPDIYGDAKNTCI